MMTEKKQLHVGKILDAHGIRGDVYALVFSGDVSWAEGLKTLHLRLASGPRALEIRRLKPFKKGFIATFSEIADRNAAEALKGAEIWVDADRLVAEPGESFYLREILDFTVHDRALGNIGRVTAFSSNGPQDLLVITSGGREYEIPFVRDFVADIIYGEKIIHTELPEGLLEINTAAGGDAEADDAD